MIGNLRHRGYVIRENWADDGMGGQILAGESRQCVWVGIKSSKGGTVQTSGAVRNAETLQLIMRKTDVSASDAIEVAGKRYLIDNVAALNDREGYLLLEVHRREVTGG